MYVVFGQTIQQNRINGARGGRAYARNLRLRQLLAPPAPASFCGPQPLPETAHEASLLLDRQFPWLAGVFISRAQRKRMDAAR
jgi:hypothetical protein